MGLKCFQNFLLIGVVLFIGSTSMAQAPFREFGIKNYGKKISEPFHSGGTFSQDSLGRLHFSNFYFDGQDFTRKVDTMGRVLAIEESGGSWYKQDHFQILYLKDGKRTLFNTKQYFKYDVNNVYLKDDRVFLVTNLGAIEYIRKGENIEFRRTIPVSDEDLWSMHIIGDTLFFKTLKQSRYLLESDLENENFYGPKRLSDFNNGILYLPNQRIVSRSDHFVEREYGPNSLAFKAITQVDDINIISHLIDSKGRVWLGLRGKGKVGLYMASAKSPVLEVVDIGIDESIYIQNIFEDDQENIWVSTNGQGIVQLYEDQIQVLNKDIGLQSDNIWSCSQDQNGRLFFSASCNGIDVLNTEGELSHKYGTSCQESLLHDSKGNFWINTVGVTRVSPNGRTRNFQKNDGLMSRNGRVLFEDSNGVIWVGTRKGIHRFDDCENKEDCVEKFVPFPVPGIEDFDRVMAMREYAKGKYIIAFGSGKIFLFDGLIYWPLDFADRKVNSVFKDIEGRIWIASDGDGLFILKDEKIEACNRSNDLPKAMKFLQDDRNGKLWGICEGNRIFSFSKAAISNENLSLNLQYLSNADGIPLIASNNDIQPSSLLLQDGRIIFPNIYGAILLNPNKGRKVLNDYKTIISNGDDIVSSRIQLAYGENDLTLLLKPIVLAQNNAVQYQYKLIDQWIDVPKSRQLTLKNLANGKNKVHLRTRSANDDWRELDILEIEVQPLLLQRWSFWILAGLLFSGLVYLLVKWRTSIVKQRNKLLKEKVKEQTVELEMEKEQLSKSLEKQKQLTYELNLSQASKNRMYAQISHEFKSPLQAIKTSLETENSPLLVDNKKRISKNINNLLDISNEIMDLSKAESGKLKAKKNWYNINGIIKEQIELKAPLANVKNLQVVFNPDVERYFLEVDISLMQKVVGNLLSNAIKFSEVDGLIAISSKTVNEKHVVSVIDNGVGIPSAELASITLPYFQASNNLEKGTGIGLSLVAEILKIHDSELRIESTLGEGSTFSFELKKAKISQVMILQEHVDSVDLQRQLSDVATTKLPVILAVDDSSDVLFFISQSLSNTFKVITATNGETALAVLEKVEPELIISDVNMPIMNGMELLKEVRSFDRYKAIPFLFLTGSLSEDTELQSIKAGADYVLQKPVQEEYLISKIEQIIARQKNVMEMVTSSFSHNLLPKNIHNDDLFLIRTLEKTILENISNSKLKSEDIANFLGVGEKTLRNRVKKITGLTLKEYLRSIRLEKAKLLIESEFGNLGEVANATGFSSLSYFSKSYKAYFDK